MLKKMKPLLICVALAALLVSCSSSSSPAEEDSDLTAPPPGKVWTEHVDIEPLFPPSYRISFDLPAGWEYEVRRSDGEQTGDVAVLVYPEGTGGEDGYICIRCTGMFAVCGTGLRTEESEFNGIRALTGYYDGSDIWDFISLQDDYSGCAVLNLGKEWPDRYEPYVNTILYSLEFTYLER